MLKETSINNFPELLSIELSDKFVVSQLVSVTDLTDSQICSYLISYENLSDYLGDLSVDVNTAGNLDEVIQYKDIVNYYPNTSAAYEVYDNINGIAYLSGNNVLSAGDYGNDFTEAKLSVNTDGEIDESPVNVNFLKVFFDNTGGFYYPDYDNYVVLTNANDADISAVVLVNKPSTNVIEYTFKENCWVNFRHVNWLNKDVMSKILVKENNTSTEWIEIAASLSYATSPKHGITGDSGMIPFPKNSIMRVQGKYFVMLFPMNKS